MHLRVVLQPHHADAGPEDISIDGTLTQKTNTRCPEIGGWVNMSEWSGSTLQERLSNANLSKGVIAQALLKQIQIRLVRKKAHISRKKEGNIRKKEEC